VPQEVWDYPWGTFSTPKGVFFLSPIAAADGWLIEDQGLNKAFSPL
jgi:hypothetical protein